MTLHCYCPPCLRLEIVTILAFPQGWPAWRGGSAPSMQKLLELTSAAHGQTWPSGKAPSCHCGLPAFSHCHQNPWGCSPCLRRGREQNSEAQGLWDQKDLGTNPGSTSYRCVTLGQLLTLSVPQFSDTVTMAVPTS